MRCGCPHCGAYMIQAEEKESACVCADCGYRCNACMGTNTVISREDLLKMKNEEWFTPRFEADEEDTDV